MSGHTNFTSWIDSGAEYVLLKDGTKAMIETTFFTSDGMPNSDTFNIKTDKGVFELSDIDFEDLSNRHGSCDE